MPEMTARPTASASPLARPTSRVWIGIALFFVLVFDPGIMSNDSIASLRQARAFEFTSWHPPIMAMIWAPLDKVIAGPAGMLLCQALLFAYAAAKLCASAFPHLCRRYPAWLVVGVFTLFPPVMTLVGMIWKDIWMSAFLLLALAHLFLLRDSVTTRDRRKHGIAVLAYCLAATAFRHNALAATAGLLAGAAYFLYTPPGFWRRLFVSSAAGVLASVVLYLGVGLFNSLVSTRAELTTGIYLHDIAGVIVYSGEPEQAARAVLDSPVPLTDDQAQFLPRLYRAYTPAAAGRLLRSSKRPQTPFSVNVYALDHDAASVQRIRKALIGQYPLAYLKHRTTTFACLLQFCDRKLWAYHSYVMNKQYALPATLDKESWQYALRKVVLSDKLAPLYHPGFWLMVTLVAGVVGFVRLRSGRPSLLLFVGLSSAGLALSLYFTSPIESYRYMHWCMLLGWISLALIAERFATPRSTP